MADYIENVLNASGGYAAPAENLKDQDIRESLEAAGMLIPEEQDLASALLEIVDKYGKFNDDNTGVWAGYISAKDNAETAQIGVKCGNCVFWQAPNGCQIIVAETEEGGLCRFAVLPDNTVTASADEAANLEKDEDDPCWSGYVQVGMKDKNGKRVPNCVPSASTLDYVIASANEEFGVARQLAPETAYEVARKACSKYEYISDEELYSAVLWDVMSFVEYATTGVTEDEEEMAEYADLLPEGHPATESSLVASLLWVASASELDNSGRQVVLKAFSDDSDYVDSLHASTRLKVLLSSGTLSETTAAQLKATVKRYYQVD
jgi:hypothetical protein